MTHSDTKSFALLVVEHQAGLRAWVRALGVEECAVDDFAQEAFIVAYRRRTEWDAARGEFGSWLRGIARHLVIAERRKGARRARLLGEALGAALLDPADDGEAHSFSKAAEVNAALDGCVEALGAAGAELLRRRYAAGETALALAARAGQSAEAMRQRLLRLRLAVRECMERKLGTEAWL